MENGTSLSTYGVLREILAWELIRCRRYRRLVSVLLIDLDHLRDAIPTTAARQVTEAIDLVRQQIREVDLVGSRGRNGLIVLLPETGKQGALVVSERLRQSIEAQLRSLPSSPGYRPAAVTMGASGYLEDADSAEGLLASAEAALMEARARRGEDGTSAQPPQVGALAG
jgi:diguanylate cyclase (GGDEF)-like protein